MSRSKRVVTASTVLVALLAAFIGLRAAMSMGAEQEEKEPFVRGRNETVLFFALAESGQINPQLATAEALMEKYPNIEVHFASFSRMAEKVAEVSSHAVRKTSSTQGISFHELQGIDRSTAIEKVLNCSSAYHCLTHSPGARGIGVLAPQLESVMWPWTGEEHEAVFESAMDVVRQVDPAVVVVDFAFRPAVDATLKLNRQHIIFTPVAIADLFAMLQPYGAVFWKYPAWGTGFSFPVRWYQIPENIYVTLRLAYTLVVRPATGKTLAYLRERGIDAGPLVPPNPLVPFITQTLPGASIPLEYVPPNTTLAGVILLSSSTAAEQDPELVEWVSRAPTIIVNLGSLFKYTEERAKIMAQAIQVVLKTTNVQVLWKMAAISDFDQDYAEPLKSHLFQDRVRISSWLTIDTFPLLELSNIVASVHHGGSSSYNEAIAAGVPQVIIPLWEDLYNFAQLSEDLGVGIYATRKTAPEWTVDGLAEPIVRVVDESEPSVKRRMNAKRIGEIAREKPGKYVAAEVVAKYAQSGQV